MNVQDSMARKQFMMYICPPRPFDRLRHPSGFLKNVEIGFNDKADGPEVKPEDGRDLGDDSEAEHHVQQGEEAEQVVHGLMQRGLQPDGDQEGGLGPHGQKKKDAEGHGQPELPVGRLDKAIQEEV